MQTDNRQVLFPSQRWRSPARLVIVRPQSRGGRRLPRSDLGYDRRWEAQGRVRADILRQTSMTAPTRCLDTGGRVPIADRHPLLRTRRTLYVEPVYQACFLDSLD